ncbi:hypothetical protein [Oceanobacillus neutriphilus]|uniref:Lipoprotein n=1 Tax=Oceanobacillus neutriphilus TaxID=531815 RepID=A0ABQ2NUT1_9BACI|nr:hypothetical protein [Oceanobacillus neutriphilus]GGP11022.1 hypothetical protein GCM10011346_21470 [Oceanobacillus neutriphilus]
MKKYKVYLCNMVSMLLLLSLLAACSNDSEDGSAADSPENDSAMERIENEPDATDDKVEVISEEEDASKDSGEDNTSENTAENEEDGASENSGEDVSENGNDSLLDGYTAEEIEYARVWLQIVGNQDIEELNVSHVAAGEQVNPNEEDSADYPEDVITLQGKVMAEVQ